MNKPELLQWLMDEQQKWELLLAAIGETRMEQPGVSGDWSIRDIIMHLTVWQQWLVARLQAAGTGHAAPLPPWGADVTSDDAINAWMAAAQRTRTIRDVLDDAQMVYDHMRATIQALPEACRIEMIDAKYPVIWVQDQRFAPGEFFHHFYEDHAADVRSWLERGA